MILTKKQEEGLSIAVQRYKNHEKFTVISGYAGCGKSTLVRFIIEALPGVDKEDVAFATFTGKAAQVLANKGNENCMTLHKLLYDSFPRPDGTFMRVPKVELGYHVVVVDEVSMAPKNLMDLLFSHGCYVICLGDPFQLPPINANEDNHLLDHPHIFLDEIMRQAAESEIIRLTMRIRNHEEIGSFSGSEMQIMDKREVSTGMLMWADQILVGTNKVRKTFNEQMRKLRGIESPYPVEDDKVICLRNYWDVFSNGGDALVNGTIGYLRHCIQRTHAIPKYYGGGSIESTLANFIIDNEENLHYGSLNMDTHMILTGEKWLSPQIAYRLSKSKKYMDLVPYEFTYAYAITYWKAQGSEWDKVLIVEEEFPWDKETHERAMYTALTRASKKAVWLRNF